MNHLLKLAGCSSVILSTSLVTTSAHSETHRTLVEVPVTTVEPVVRVVTHKIPHETCRDERVRVEHASRSRSATPSILGALIGGAVAGSLGHNSRAQPAIAVAGAVLGASVGSDVSRSKHRRHYYVNEQRCEIDYELRDEENIIGYRVGYLYGDNIYHTQTRDHPGDTIKLRVELSPAD